MLDRVSWSDVADYLPAAFGAMLGLSYAKNQTPKQKVVSFLSAFGLAVYLGAAIAELMNLGPKATIAVGVLTAVVGMDVIGGLLASTFATLTILPSIYSILQGKASVSSPSLNPRDPASRYYEAQ